MNLYIAVFAVLGCLAATSHAFLPMALMQERAEAADLYKREAAEEQAASDDEVDRDVLKRFAEALAAAEDEEDEAKRSLPRRPMDPPWVNKRGLFACKKLTESCSGTAFSRCCGELRCHKPNFWKSGNCMVCKGPGSYCLKDKECCPLFECSKLKCKLKGLAKRNDEEGDSAQQVTGRNGPGAFDGPGPLDAEKRKLFACKNPGESCSGTAFSRCCGSLKCHKPNFWKSGTCMACKSHDSYCLKDSECCQPLLECSKLRCRARGLRKRNDGEEDSAAESLQQLANDLDKRAEEKTEEISADKRALFKCKEFGASCSGTAFSRCCGEMKCHKPKFWKSGTCAMCKGEQSLCMRDKECCLGFTCTKLRCKPEVPKELQNIMEKAQ